MIRRRRCAAAVAGAALAGVLALAAGAQDDAESSAEELEARVTKVEGTVYLHAHDAAADEFVAAEVGAPLEEGDMVRTGTDGTAEIALDGHSIIQVAPDSDFSVNSLEPEQAEFHLGIGAFVAKIRSLLQGQRMEFHTSEAVAAVRGTELAVAQEEDGEPSKIGVFDEGSVSVRKPTGHEEVQLGPGQETAVLRGRDLGRPRPMRDLLAHRRLLEGVRRRIGALRKSWVARPKAQRAALRARLMKRPRLKADGLKNVRPDRRGRLYRQLQRRQALLRQGRAARRAQRRRANQGGKPRPRPEPKPKPGPKLKPRQGKRNPQRRFRRGR